MIAFDCASVRPSGNTATGAWPAGFSARKSGVRVFARERVDLDPLDRHAHQLGHPLGLSELPLDGLPYSLIPPSIGSSSRPCRGARRARQSKRPHIAEGSALVAGDAYQRAKISEWLFWEQRSHEPAIAVRVAQEAYLGNRDEELSPALLTKGYAAFARMELQLQRTPYLVGDALTLAGIALVAYTRGAHKGGFELSHYPAVKVWVARVERDLGLESACVV